jgi:baculoviral IAP repeat-containing protein 6
LFISEYSPCDNDTKLIPEQVLLETHSLPSPLQVFASQGGLALLAEHLPLLYPEITRQVSPPDGTRDTVTNSGIGNDWVTVEYGEDIYEVNTTLVVLIPQRFALIQNMVC